MVVELYDTEVHFTFQFEITPCGLQCLAHCIPVTLNKSPSHFEQVAHVVVEVSSHRFVRRF